MRKYWVRVRQKSGDILALIIYDRKTGLAAWEDVTPEESLLIPIDRPLGFKKRVKKFTSLYFPVTREEFIKAKITGQFYISPEK